jgi:hypothetical protein
MFELKIKYKILNIFFCVFFYLQTKRFDELHQMMNSFIDNASNSEGFKTPMRLGDTAEFDQILVWLNRIGIATNFDTHSMQHYQAVQSKWQVMSHLILFALCLLFVCSLS